MGNHRAERSGPRRRPSETPIATTPYVGRRVAGGSDFVETAEFAPITGKQGEPGKRRAIQHAGSRGALFKGLPSAPILLGIAALAISAGGAMTTAGPSVADTGQPRLSQASALRGASAVSSYKILGARTNIVSRDSRRDALADAADDDLVAEAEAQAEQRNAALATFAQKAEQQADKIALNQWILPTEGYHLTARFGDYGLWSSYHTGLDFAADTGTPIVAIANGVVTSVGYDGSYGNKTVLTLDDGTELWFCHQNSTVVNTGDIITAGELIGYVGSTGNVTGPHLHLEVRPGGGDPVDPYAALVAHGITP